jgi:putative aminopeptidase FrvX
MALPVLLDRLLRAAGPTGAETQAAAVWREAAAAYGEVTHDHLGTSVVRVPGTGGGPLLALYAHIDEIGFTVSHVQDDGLLRVSRLGGWDARTLAQQRVTILGRSGEVPGVAAKQEDEKLEWTGLTIDIGARDAADARRLVREGDVGVYAGEPVELANGRFASRALDNRAGAWAVLEALRLLAEAPAQADVAAVASVQEEITHAGAATTTFALQPDVALAVDITFATDTPGTEPALHGQHVLGGGPTVFSGPPVHPRVRDLLVEAAEAEGIAHTLETGSRSGTDADEVFRSRTGVPSGLVSIPIRYFHSPVETAQLSDLEDVARLIAAFARRLRPDLEWTR